MRKFKCTICGFIYGGDDIPEDFACPLCGAPRTAFEELKDDIITVAPEAAPEVVEDEHFESLTELAERELSVLCSNLAKGCEKQQMPEESELFKKLADYYKSKATLQDGGSLDDVKQLLDDDLSEKYSRANAVSTARADRGALRALVWGEKVSRMIKSLLERYAREGEAMLENTKVYVCDICGFIYVGNVLPEVCPVCKVPNFKILQVGRR